MLLSHSLCIARNQPECVYRQKPLSKAKSKPVSQQRRRTSSITITKRPAERADSSMGDVLMALRPCGVVQSQYGAVVMPKFPVKRSVDSCMCGKVIALELR